MANLPANRTKLQSAVSDQSQSITPASGKANREALIEAYDTIDMLNGKVDSVVSEQNLKLLRTIADMTLYVNPTGSDSSDGLTSGTALKTIQAAVNKLPQIINHQITINIDAGSYNDQISIKGLIGYGTISVIGSQENDESRKATSLSIENCTCNIIINGFRFLTTTTSGVSATNCSAVKLQLIQVSDFASFAGFTITNSLADIVGCLIYNRQYGIRALLSTVYSNNNVGGANVYGLAAENGATIGKNAAQPAATTAEAQVGGGVIR